MSLSEHHAGGSQLHPGLRLQIRKEDLIGSNGKRYRAADELVSAVNVALHLERPLLLTGEPGCGKTEFAHACARALGFALKYPADKCLPLVCSIGSATRARDLLYAYDAVRRFSDAQSGGDAGHRRAQDSRNYIALQPLGCALASRTRRVVLLDEIDKAPRDLPNDLLQELDKGLFSIPEIVDNDAFKREFEGEQIDLMRYMRRPRQPRPPHHELPQPLVIITSNAEAQLPDAFLRRCIFWHIKFPVKELPDIIEDHFPELDPGFWQRARVIFLELRAVRGLAKTPGTAELLDWVRALSTVLDPQVTQVQLKQFSTLLDQGASHLPWTALPGLSCLIKLRSDLALLELAQ